MPDVSALRCFALCAPCRSKFSCELGAHTEYLMTETELELRVRTAGSANCLRIAHSFTNASQLCCGLQQPIRKAAEQLGACAAHFSTRMWSQSKTHLPPRSCCALSRSPFAAARWLHLWRRKAGCQSVLPSSCFSSYALL